ncbi:MAG: nuclear transport factor 2 family protein [Pikeienuella sp.]
MIDEAKLRELLDREAIRDCIHRYCRGIDRADEAALVSAYWPDAHDSHGAFTGSAAEFFTWVRAAWATGPRNIHNVGNTLIEFRAPDRAAVETYFLALQRGAGPDGITRQVLLAGRYCDLFEKRGEEWRVKDRTVVYDWVDHQAPPEGGEADRFGPRRPIGAAFPDDPVYAIGERTRAT